jgi:2-oxoglutarate dehydrogenase complex dehydrogenase (E1) component-like enzyme
MLVDQQTEATTVPLNEPPLQGTLELANSPLSELSVLAFEAGQSWARPRLLPLWEAQVGALCECVQVSHH